MNEKCVLAPIIMFVYNRPWHTQQTIEALKNNESAVESDLIIYSDGPKNDRSRASVLEVRDYIKTVDGFKSIKIIERNKNWGLAANIIDGVTEVVNKYGKVIVMEDDLVTSPLFLRFMNDALTAYESIDNVGCIHGYIYPIEGIEDDFFIKGADCWGWATWSRAWKCFEPNGKKLLRNIEKSELINDSFNVNCGYISMLENQILGLNDSWAIRWYFSCLIRDMYCLYPGITYVNNIGLDNTGTHCGKSGNYNSVLKSKYDFKIIPVEENLLSKHKIEKFHIQSKSIIKRILQRIRGYLNK